MQYPAEHFIEDAILAQRGVGLACERLQEAIHDARTAKATLKDAEDALRETENGVAANLAIQAMGKEGPLAGIATSSKAYQTVMDAELAKARAGQLSKLDIAVKRAQATAESATIELEQAQAQFSAARHSADLLAAMLHATRI